MLIILYMKFLKNSKCSMIFFICVLEGFFRCYSCFKYKIIVSLNWINDYYYKKIL